MRLLQQFRRPALESVPYRFSYKNINSLVIPVLVGFVSSYVGTSNSSMNRTCEALFVGEVHK